MWEQCPTFTVSRSVEVADMAARRRLDFCCLQETRWRGDGVKILEGREGAKFKFLWKGSEDGAAAGVGVLVAEKSIKMSLM